MVSASFLLTALVASSASAFFVPRDMPDGVYTVHEEDGKEIHTPSTGIPIVLAKGADGVYQVHTEDGQEASAPALDSRGVATTLALGLHGKKRPQARDENDLDGRGVATTVALALHGKKKPQTRDEEDLESRGVATTVALALHGKKRPQTRGDGYSTGQEAVHVRRGLGTRDYLCNPDDAKTETDAICMTPVKKCGSEEIEDHESVDAANRALGEQMDGGARATLQNPRVYSKVNGIVAYICHHQDGANDILYKSRDLRRSLDRITKTCGAYFGGEIGDTEASVVGSGFTVGWGVDDGSFCTETYTS